MFDLHKFYSTSANTHTHEYVVLFNVYFIHTGTTRVRKICFSFKIEHFLWLRECVLLRFEIKPENNIFIHSLPIATSFLSTTTSTMRTSSSMLPSSSASSETKLWPMWSTQYPRYYWPYKESSLRRW